MVGEYLWSKTTEIKHPLGLPSDRNFGVVWSTRPILARSDNLGQIIKEVFVIKLRLICCLLIIENQLAQPSEIGMIEVDEDSKSCLD